MKKNINKKILKRIGAIVCALAVALVAFVVPFSSKFSKVDAKHLVASADEKVETVYNSNTWVFGYSYGASSLYNVSSPFNFSLVNTNSGVSLTINILSTATSAVVVSSYSCIVSAGDFYFDMPYRTESLLTVHCYTVLESGVFDVSSILYANLGNFEINSSLRITYIEWIDANQNCLRFGVYMYSSGSGAWSSYIPYNARVYLPNSLSADYNSGYKAGFNEGYSAGESSGYSAGYSEGEEFGYSNGYNSGELIGYNNGYLEGIENGGKYTFFNLISAVIDAPIQAFMGLFNFELLGINLAGFFTGLLTLAFIITIVRLVMP